MDIASAVIGALIGATVGPIVSELIQRAAKAILDRPRQPPGSAAASSSLPAHLSQLLADRAQLQADLKKIETELEAARALLGHGGQGGAAEQPGEPWTT